MCRHIDVLLHANKASIVEDLTNPASGETAKIATAVAVLLARAAALSIMFMLFQSNI